MDPQKTPDLEPMTSYEQTLRKNLIPFLEGLTSHPTIWRRSWEDSFRVGSSRDVGLPQGLYSFVVIKTGELIAQGIHGSRQTFTIFDERVKGIYSALEAQSSN